MGVKIVESLPGKEKKEQLNELKDDIREIIDKRIKISEIVNVKYSNGTLRERLHRAMRDVLWDISKTLGDRRVPSRDEIFEVNFRKIDGQPHWYVKFDVNLWDRRMREIRGTLNDDITFCQEDCEMENCMRNKKNIADRRIPHSFSVERPEDCPKCT